MPRCPGRSQFVSRSAAAISWILGAGLIVSCGDTDRLALATTSPSGGGAPARGNSATSAAGAAHGAGTPNTNGGASAAGAAAGEASGGTAGAVGHSAPGGTSGGGSGASSHGGQAAVAGASTGGASAGNSGSGGNAGAAGSADSCSDGVKDGNETDVDCGGGCGPCLEGHLCKTSLDCTVHHRCDAGVCVATSLGFEITPSLKLEGNRFAVADFDEDGNIDVGTASGAVLIVRRGNGDGTFGTVLKTKFSIPVDAVWLLGAGDVDGDGHVDAVVLTEDGSFPPKKFVVTFRGDGAGAFDVAATTPADGMCEGRLVDANGDGHLDAFLAPCSVQLARWSLALGNGDGTFEMLASEGVASEYVLGVGDFDHDGIADALPAFGTGPTGGLLLRAFTPDPEVSVWPSVECGYSAAIVDVNGDGNLDVIGCRDTGTGDRLTVFGDGNGGIAATVPISAGTNTLGWEVVDGSDLDADGSIDVVWKTTAAGGLGEMALRVDWGSGDGSFSSGDIYRAGNLFLSHAIAADLNADGRPDLLTDGDRMRVLLNQGKRRFLAQRMTEADAFSGSPAIDVDGDGRDDLLVNATLYRSRGNGAFDPVALGFGDAVALVAGDFDGDGTRDLAGVAWGTIAFARGLGGGVFAPPVQSPLPQDVQGYVPTATGDFDGDGRPEIVLVGTMAFSLASFDASGAFTSSAVVSTPTYIGAPGSLFAIEATGDGHLDIVCITGFSGMIAVLPGDGMGHFIAPIVSQGCSPASVFDANGDGLADVVDCDGQAVGIRLNDGTGQFSSLLATDLWPYMAADFDRDGRVDLAGAVSGELRVALAHGDGTFEKSVTSDLVETNGHLISGDFDGDGERDVLVYDSDLLLTYLNRSK